MRLAVRGTLVAQEAFRNAIYDLDDDGNDVRVNIDARPKHTTIVAEGKDVLFVEFGAGAMYGYGHPQAYEFDFGPGTYNPDSDNWRNPKGWWYTGADGKSHHSYGNSPAMAMYQAAKEVRQSLPEVAREVFKA